MENKTKDSSPMDASVFKKSLMKQIDRVYNLNAPDERVRNMNKIFDVFSMEIVSLLSDQWISTDSRRQISHAMTQLEKTKDFSTRTILFCENVKHQSRE